MLGLEYRKKPAFHRQPGEADGVVRRRAPAKRARHVDVDIARAVDAHRLDDLLLQVVEVGNRRGSDVGNAVGKCAECLAASLAGAMAAGERVRSINRGLNGTFTLRYQP